MASEDKSSIATELVKKIVTASVGAIFLTEESLRTMVKEFKLPKEFLSGLLASAGKTKTDFLRTLSQEVMDRITRQMDLKETIEDVLRKNEISVTINVKPKGD